MKIYTTVTPAFEPACEEWLIASVGRVEPGRVVEVECFSEIEGEGDFQSASFRAHNLEKNRMLSEWIRRNEGEVIFVTDADIVYFRPFVRLLEEQLGDADLALARETIDGGSGYNIGQMVIRCSEKMRRFVDFVGACLAEGGWDQDLVNRGLAGGLVSCKPLDAAFANTGVWRGMNRDQRMNAVSYHATESHPDGPGSGLEKKRRFIDEVTREWRSLQPVAARPRGGVASGA